MAVVCWWWSSAGWQWAMHRLWCSRGGSRKILSLANRSLCRNTLRQWSHSIHRSPRQIHKYRSSPGRDCSLPGHWQARTVSRTKAIKLPVHYLDLVFIYYSKVVVASHNISYFNSLACLALTTTGQLFLTVKYHQILWSVSLANVHKLIFIQFNLCPYSRYIFSPINASTAILSHSVCANWRRYIPHRHHRHSENIF